jgi:hypothetical protein
MRGGTLRVAGTANRAKTSCVGRDRARQPAHYDIAPGAPGRHELCRATPSARETRMEPRRGRTHCAGSGDAPGAERIAHAAGPCRAARRAAQAAGLRRAAPRAAQVAGPHRAAPRAPRGPGQVTCWKGGCTASSWLRRAAASSREQATASRSCRARRAGRDRACRGGLPCGEGADRAEPNGRHS